MMCRPSFHSVRAIVSSVPKNLCSELFVTRHGYGIFIFVYSFLLSHVGPTYTFI